MDSKFMQQIWDERHYGTPLAVIFTVIPTAAIGLRLYAKIAFRQPIEASDYLAVSAWTFTISFFITMLVAVYLPASYVENADGIDVPVSKITFSLNLLWVCACYCCKLSILCGYYRLLSTPSSPFRMAVRGVFALTLSIGVASALGFLLIFRPLSWWWTTALEAEPTAQANELKMNEAIDIMSLITDVIICLLPLPVLSNLKLNRTKKFLLIGLFLLGLLTCIEVLVRILITYGFHGAFDAIQVQCLLMAIEPALGITICSLPIFLRLFRRGKSDLSSSRYHVSGASGQGDFYPLSYSTARRSKRDPDEALLDSIHMDTVGKPLPVKVKTEIIVQFSDHEHHSMASRDSF